MKLCELINTLNEVIDNNDDNNLKPSYEKLIRPVINKLSEDAKLLLQITNRDIKEIKELDIRTFYTEVNLCKKIKNFKSLDYEGLYCRNL